MTGLVLAMFLAFGAGLVLGAGPRDRGRSELAWLSVLAGAVLGVVAGARGLAGGVQNIGLGWITWAPAGSAPGSALGLRVDHLAGFFLLLVMAVAIPAVLVTVSWWHRTTSSVTWLPSGCALLLGSCAVVVLAANVFILLAGWELLTAAFYWATVMERRRDGRVGAALGAVSFGKASGAALLIGTLLLAGSAHSLALQDLGQGPHGALRTTGYVLLVVAFAIKVGLFPLHIWMPRSYSAAPGPVRALMAGACVNVGFYGLWRTLDVLGPPPGWLAVVVMLAGAVSALIGIAHASVQTRLTRVIASSSVENAGLIVAGYGVALVGAAAQMPGVMAAGLLAATLQVVAHAIGKTLMFVSGGVIEAVLDTDELDDLRGVARIMPWSGTGLALGSIMMAGLPPTAMFVSEWFTLETLMQQFRLRDHLGYALPLALTGALVALTTGFAGVAFVRLAAFTALGPTPVRERGARDVGPLGRGGIVALCLAVFAVAALTPWEIRLIARALDAVAPAHLISGSVTDRWILGPVYPGFSVLSPTLLVMEMPLMLAATALVAYILSSGRLTAVRHVAPWRSATGGVDGADEYTPYGYANPTRHVLANVLRPWSNVSAVDPAERADGQPELDYQADVIEVTERYAYEPLRRLVAMGVRWATSLQNGRLDVYLLYMLIVFVAALGVVAAIG